MSTLYNTTAPNSFLLQDLIGGRIAVPITVLLPTMTQQSYAFYLRFKAQRGLSGLQLSVLKSSGRKLQ